MKSKSPAFRRNSFKRVCLSGWTRFLFACPLEHYLVSEAWTARILERFCEEFGAVTKVVRG